MQESHCYRVAGDKTLCDPIWHVISCSGVMISIINCYIHLMYITYLHAEIMDLNITKQNVEYYLV